MLAMLVTTTLVILGVTSLPTYAAAPTLKLAINADEDSYLCQASNNDTSSSFPAPPPLRAA